MGTIVTNIEKTRTIIKEPLTVAGPWPTLTPPSPHLKCPKSALQHLRTCARVIEKDLAGNRRRITCSNPKKSRKNGTPGSPGQNSKTQRGKEEQHFGGGQCQHCTKIFTLVMMCRSILSSLTEACTLQVHASEMLIDRIADIY